MAGNRLKGNTMEPGQPGVNKTFFRRLCLVLILCIAATGAPGRQDAMAKGSNQILELEQTNRLYGRLLVSIDKNRVKAMSMDKDFCFLCKAPSWDVVAFNTKRKMVHVFPYQTWSKHGLKTAMTIENNEGFIRWPLVLIRKEKYAGMDASVYALPKAPKASLNEGVIGEYWVVDSKKFDRNVTMFMRALHDVPYVDGLAMRFIRAYGGHSWGFRLDYNLQQRKATPWMSTRKSRMVAELPKLFDTPQGFKVVSDSEVLMNSAEVTDTLMDIMK